MFEYANKQNKVRIKALQQVIGVTPDGVIGPNTLKALKKYWDCEVIAHEGMPVPLNNTADYVVEHDLSLYELPDGERNWCNRSQKAETICMHWGGFNARHLFRIFYNSKGRHVSTHFGIGRDPKDNNRIEVMQYLDTGLQSYHAGKFNKFSVGVDICQAVESKHLDKALKGGHNVQIIKCDSDRGPDEMLSLDPEIASVAKAFIRDLAIAMGIDHKPVCKDEEVYGIADACKFSVVSHLNISNRKWDIAINWASVTFHEIDFDKDLS